MLSEADPYSMEGWEIEFDFISPDKDKFRRVALPIDEKQYLEFKKTVEEVYDKIII